MAPDTDAGRVGPASNRLLLPGIGKDFGTLDDDLRAGCGLVTDHLRRADTAARRTHAFAVGAGCDDDTLPRLQQLGRLANSAEGARLIAGPRVIGARRAVVHVVGLREGQRLFPAGEFAAVGQASLIGRVAGRSSTRGVLPPRAAPETGPCTSHR